MVVEADIADNHIICLRKSVRFGSVDTLGFRMKKTFSTMALSYGFSFLGAGRGRRRGLFFAGGYGRSRLQNPRRSAEQRSRWGEEERRTEGVPPPTASKRLEFGDCGLASAWGVQGDGIADETEKAPDSQKESGAFG